jgi:NADPH:quinone reductase-like Zn-dependent oxidoreductase
MRAVTFQAPGQVRLEERPEPELQARDDAIVRVEASGICGSDLHLFRGRVPREPASLWATEYVGTIEATGDAVSAVAVGEQGPCTPVRGVAGSAWLPEPSESTWSSMAGAPHVGTAATAARASKVSG